MPAKPEAKTIETKSTPESVEAEEAAQVSVDLDNADAESSDTESTGNSGADSVAPNTEKSIEDQISEGKKASKENKKEALKRNLRDYVVPGVVYLLSLIIIFTVAMPVLNTIVINFQQISDLQQKYNMLTARKASVESLSSVNNTQKQMITVVNRIIPLSQTAVVDFSEEIQAKAKQNQLKLTSTIVRETVTVNQVTLNSETGTGDTRLELVELPAEFSISGNFVNIQKFLSDLYQGNDFIIIKKMDLQKVVSTEGDGHFSAENSDEWVMSIVLTKYQFRLSGNKNDAELQNTYFSVPETLRPNEEVLEFILKNYGGGTQTTAPTPTTAP